MIPREPKNAVKNGVRRSVSVQAPLDEPHAPPIQIPGHCQDCQELQRFCRCRPKPIAVDLPFIWAGFQMGIVELASGDLAGGAWMLAASGVLLGRRVNWFRAGPVSSDQVPWLVTRNKK